MYSPPEMGGDVSLALYQCWLDMSSLPVTSLFSCHTSNKVTSYSVVFLVKTSGSSWWMLAPSRHQNLFGRRRVAIWCTLISPSVLHCFSPMGSHPQFVRLLLVAVGGRQSHRQQGGRSLEKIGAGAEEGNANAFCRCHGVSKRVACWFFFFFFPGLPVHQWMLLCLDWPDGICKP